MQDDYTDAATPQSDIPEENLILSDCEGTLYDWGKPNLKLIKFLLAAHDHGYKVQIFSNDPTGSSLALRMMEIGDEEGLVEKLLNISKIAHKNEFSGEKAFIVFDDNHSSHKVDCENQYAPDDARIDKMMAYLKASDDLIGKPTGKDGQHFH